MWRCAHTGLLSDCPPTSAIPIISGSAVAVLGVENAGFLVALEFPVEVGVASGGGSTQVRTAPDGPPSLANLMNIGLTLQSQAESEAATARDVCGGDPSAQLMLVGPTPSDSFHALASLPLPTVRVPDLISFHVSAQLCGAFERPESPTHVCRRERLALLPCQAAGL